MEDKFIRLDFERLFQVDKLITLFYMEMSKDFHYDGERHDFWEMVYIDKGEMVCTADQNRFMLTSGEMTFHKPGEFHNLSGNNQVAPNVSIITFECHSPAIEQLEGRIFRLDGEEKALLSTLFAEGLASYRLVEINNPLLQQMQRVESAPPGGSQMVKNLLEIFLIRLYRHTDVVTKTMRRRYTIDGMEVPAQVKEIVEFLQERVYGRLTVRDVAHHVGKSESTVKQLFSRYYPGGLVRYYTALKIKEARRLIRQGGYNMTQIAERLHFDTPQYFAKCFKACTGMTPSEYKTSILK